MYPFYEFRSAHDIRTSLLRFFGLPAFSKNQYTILCLGLRLTWKVYPSFWHCRATLHCCLDNQLKGGIRPRHFNSLRILICPTFTVKTSRD